MLCSLARNIISLRYPLQDIRCKKLETTCQSNFNITVPITSKEQDSPQYKWKSSQKRGNTQLFKSFLSQTQNGTKRVVWKVLGLTYNRRENRDKRLLGRDRKGAGVTSTL